VLADKGFVEHLKRCGVDIEGKKVTDAFGGLDQSYFI
jgi:hypothetical protein